MNRVPERVYAANAYHIIGIRENCQPVILTVMQNGHMIGQSKILSDLTAGNNTELGLMILNKSSFNTKIGILYYLWVDNEESQRIASITTSSGSLRDYIKKISTARKSLNGISVNEKKSPLFERKISGYMDGDLKDIGLEPIFLTGSEFEKNVWKAASRIPFGKTSSYREIAEICGRPRAYRAVGNAMGKNPVLLLVPCHRIIKSSGSLGGFSAGLDLKKRLLDLESVQAN